MTVSLRAAINAKCREFTYCPVTGTGSWRKQVAGCTSKRCALYLVRPKPSNGMAKGLTAPEFSENGHFDTVADRGDVQP